MFAFVSFLCILLTAGGHGEDSIYPSNFYYRGGTAPFLQAHSTAADAMIVYTLDDARCSIEFAVTFRVDEERTLSLHCAMDVQHHFACWMPGAPSDDFPPGDPLEDFVYHKGSARRVEIVPMARPWAEPPTTQWPPGTQRSYTLTFGLYGHDHLVVKDMRQRQQPQCEH